MEHRDTSPFLCAVTAKDQRVVREHSFVPVWMCYQIRSGPRLYRCGSPSQIQNGILSAYDDSIQQWASSAAVCRQIVRECLARGAEGFLANWVHPPSEALCQLTGDLECALSESGLTFYVPEAYGDCCESAFVLISSALSEGTLRHKLEQAAEQYGSERILLAYEQMRMDFSLPSPQKRGRPLSLSQLSALKNRYAPPIHQSEELCARYFTYEQQGRTHLVLFDDASTFQQKRSLANELQLGGFLAAWQEIKREQ